MPTETKGSGTLQSAERPAPKRSTTEAPKDKPALWAELASNPEKWFDNREDKRSEKAPDFKRKGTGEGLWLEFKGSSAVPEGITIPDTGFANSKKEA